VTISLVETGNKKKSEFFVLMKPHITRLHCLHYNIQRPYDYSSCSWFSEYGL